MWLWSTWILYEPRPEWKYSNMVLWTHLKYATEFSTWDCHTYLSLVRDSSSIIVGREDCWLWWLLSWQQVGVYYRRYLEGNIWHYRNTYCQTVMYLEYFFFPWALLKNCAWEWDYCGRLVLLRKIFVHGPVSSLGGEPGNNFVCKSQRVVLA